MFRRKESKGGWEEERGKKRKGNFGSSTHIARDLSFHSFFDSLSLSLSSIVPSFSPLVFRSSPPLLVFSFLSFTILTSEARKEIRVAPWHRLSVHFTRFAVGAITYEFPLSSRGFVSVFAFLVLPFPFFLSLPLPSPSFASHSLEVSFYRTHLKTVHTFRALSSNSPPRPKLLSSPSQFLCIQLIFSPDLLRRVSRFLPTKNKQPSSLLTKRHESCRGENGKWKKNNETAQVSLLLLDFFRSNVDRFSPRDEHNPRENRNHRWRSSIALTRKGKVLYNL